METEPRQSPNRRSTPKRRPGATAGRATEACAGAQTRLVRVARNCGLDSHSAKDVVQQAYVALLSCDSEIDEAEAWLIRVVARRCVDWKRQDAARAGLAQVLPETPPDPISPEQRLALHAALDRLPERHRMLVRARYFEGHTEADAARIAGYAPGSFKKTMTRVFAELKRELERGCEHSAKRR